MVEPRTRVQRFHEKDRAAHEKDMLRNRRGGFFQTYYNEGMNNPFEQVEGSAAKQDERTRAASTAYREEINREEVNAAKKLKEQKIENYRERIIQRENEHWDFIERQAQLGEFHAQEKRHNWRPESYVSYDILSQEDKTNASQIHAFGKQCNRRDHEINGNRKPEGLRRVFGSQVWEDNPISNRRIIYGIGAENGSNVKYMNYAPMDRDRHEQHDEHYHDDDFIARRGTFAGFDVKPHIHEELREQAQIFERWNNLGLHGKIKEKSYLTGKVGERQSRVYLQDHPDFVDEPSVVEARNEYNVLAREAQFESGNSPFLRESKTGPTKVGEIVDGQYGAKMQIRHVDYDPKEKEGRKRKFQPDTWWHIKENGEPDENMGERHSAHQDRTSFKRGSLHLEEGEELAKRLDNRAWVHQAADVSGHRRCW